MTESFGPQGAPIRVPSEAPPRDQAPEPSEPGPLDDGCYGQHTPTKNLNCVERRKAPEEEVVPSNTGGAPTVVRRDPQAGTVEVRDLSQFVSGQPGETMSTAEFESRGGTPEGAEAPESEAPEVDAAALAEKVRAASALLTVWEDKAATVLLKSDYQKGQRDNLMACIHDLRGVLGL